MKYGILSHACDALSHRILENARRLGIDQMLTRALNFAEMASSTFEEFFFEPYTPIGKIDSN
jgi:hypothetical protein